MSITWPLVRSRDACRHPILAPSEPARLRLTDREFARAKRFVFEKWRERALERREKGPTDLSRSCRFGSLFMRTVFGGVIEGNYQHQYNVIDGQIIDLSYDAADVLALRDPYRHEAELFEIDEHMASMASCRPRVEIWVAEFMGIDRSDEGSAISSHTPRRICMDDKDVLKRNRVILAHFDSYSAALVFARWGKTLLLPDALPEGAEAMSAPVDIGPEYAGEDVMEAIVRRYGLDPAELVYMGDFDEWLQTAGGAVRVHLLRFTTFEAPAKLIAPHGGVFKPISELRGSAMVELNLLRQVFNLIIGGGGHRG